MLELIKKALASTEISVYAIEETKEEGLELYFIRKKLDIRRQKKICNYETRVYRDFEEDGNSYRGCANAVIYDGMTESEIVQELNRAYASAASAKNLWYPLPEHVVSDGVDVRNPQLADAWDKLAPAVAEAAFSVDTQEDVFLNSMEIFAAKVQTHIISSDGVDVAWVNYSVEGEFVAQCVSPQDVETFEQFRYHNGFDREDFCGKIADTLQRTRDRAYADAAPVSGTYRLILSDKYVPTIFDYYTERSEASMIYAGYSGYQTGDDVQKTEDGDRLDITLKAVNPYSFEGIPMKDRVLLDQGVLQTIHGNSRFAHYLKREPTGSYRRISVAPGTVSMEEMKQKPYLHVVNFSDFQMDSFTGSFAGEIRLAYLYDGERVTRLTGGSVNGDILEAQKHMKLSCEMQEESRFIGPKAICFEEVTVAGR